MDFDSLWVNVFRTLGFWAKSCCAYTYYTCAYFVPSPCEGGTWCNYWRYSFSFLFNSFIDQMIKQKTKQNKRKKKRFSPLCLLWLHANYLSKTSKRTFWVSFGQTFQTNIYKSNKWDPKRKIFKIKMITLIGGSQFQFKLEHRQIKGCF